MGKLQALESGMSFISRIPKGKINPKTLGYICPNGQINFQNEESALTFTKNIILKALEQDKEREVIANGKRVLKIIDGDKGSVDIIFSDIPDIAGSIQYHGHPAHNGYLAMPFSDQDVKSFMMLNKVFGYKGSVLYNSIGEECIMTCPADSRLSKLSLPPVMRHMLYKINPITRFREMQIEKFIDKYIKAHDLDYYMNIMVNRCTQEERALIKQLKEKPEEVRKWMEDKINSLRVHDILKKLTPGIDIKYQTNFRHLKD